MKSIIKITITIAIAIIATIFLMPASVSGFNGHNGITFDMTQNEVEKKGFVCNPLEKEDRRIKYRCNHMDLTGVAFGYNTKDYNLAIGHSGKVIKIGANFTGIKTVSDYLNLHTQIEQFFPNKYEKGSMHEKSLTREEWRSKNNSSVVLIHFKGSPPYIQPSLVLSFWSPKSLAPPSTNNK